MPLDVAAAHGSAMYAVIDTLSLSSLDMLDALLHFTMAHPLAALAVAVMLWVIIIRRVLS